MPIYKIHQPEKVVSAKGHTHSHTSGASWTDGPAEHSHGTAGKMTYMELTEADREQERPLSGKVEVVTTLATHGHTTYHADNHHNHHQQQQHHPDTHHSVGEVKAETIITREIRQQREREEELEAMHRALHQTLKHEDHNIYHAHHPSHEVKVTAGSHDKDAGSSSHHVVTVSGAPNHNASGSSSHVAKVSGEPHNRDVGSSVHVVKVVETGHHAEHKQVTHPDVERSKVATGGKRPPGESRIIEELLEQRRREEELRRHWKEIGIEVDTRDADYTDSGFFLLDTPSPAFHEHQHQHQGSHVIVKESHGAIGHPVSKEFGSGHHQQQQHGSHVIAKESHGIVGHPVSKDAGSGHHQQHGSHVIVESHGVVGHPVSKDVGSGHHQQHQTSLMITKDGHANDAVYQHQHQQQASLVITKEGHSTAGYPLSKVVGPGHNHQHQASRGTGGYPLSKGVGSGNQHQASHATGGHPVNKEVGSGHNHQYHANQATGGHLMSKDFGTEYQHQQQHGHHTNHMITNDFHGTDAATSHQSIPTIGTGHQNEYSHHASHYNDDGHHTSNDTITGHHSNTDLKRSMSAPVIPALEAIHFEHIKPYTPHNESLMEREIKVAREREEALRLVRGLGPLASEVMHEIEVATTRPRVEDQHNPEELSRKYAENRLRTELQKEKQRELDLLKLGMIQSLSEHRKGEQVRYVEWVTPETEELREFARSRSTVQREVSRDHSLPSPSAKVSVDAEHKTVINKAHAPRAGLEVEVKGHKGNIQVEAKGPKGHIELESKGPKGHIEIEAKGPKGHVEIDSKGHHAALYNVQPTLLSPKSKDHLPAMVAHTSARTSSEDGMERQHSTKTPAEKRIELEFAEAERRESELRELRMSLLLDVGGVHSHEVKDHKETHHNARAPAKHHGDATMEVHTEVRDLRTNGIKASLDREGSDDSGERSPGSPSPGKFALIDYWDIQNTRSASP